MAGSWAPVVSLMLFVLLLQSASSSMVFELHGNVHPTGHFYVTMNIGDPPNPYFLDIDTSSNLTWLECDAGGDSCKRCNKVPHTLYRPTPNNLVPCGDSLCDALHQDLGTTKDCRRAPKQCDYEIKYLDGSSSIGVLLLDKFSLPIDSTLNAHPSIAFGCGYNQLGNSKKKTVAVDGVLGLGRGSVDLISQLKHQGTITKNVIGHCLSTEGGGYFFVGEENIPPSGVIWVPMAPRIAGKSSFYSPGQATLHLDAKLVSARLMDVVLDSGSTYTYLPEDLHTQLVSALKASLSNSLQEVSDPALTLCWKGSRPFKSVDDLKREFKSLVSLNFNDHGVTMMIPPENYLIITELGNACFGILGMPGLDMYLIGDITMQNQLVIYDNERGLLSWMPSPCDKMPNSNPPKERSKSNTNSQKVNLVLVILLGFLMILR